MIGGRKIVGNRNTASPPPANKPAPIGPRSSPVGAGGAGGGGDSVGGIFGDPDEGLSTSNHILTTDGIRGREYLYDVDELREQELVRLKAQLDTIDTSSIPNRPSRRLITSDEARSRRDQWSNKRWLEGHIQELERRSRTNEAYAPLIDNPWTRPVGEKALSTFSIDVDTASYANMRRFVSQGSLPPRDAVRIEEMVNYFTYDYAAPTEESEHPFAAHVEIADAPWNDKHRLVRIGLKGREVAMDQRPATNLVFLIDVSGSMQPRNKLPLLKQSMRLLVEHLNGDDTIAIVTYAGNSGLVLPATHCDARESILGAIDRLSAGGSTNGGAGIDLAYRLAVENFISGGINRVILATDGDFNVGVTQMSELLTLIERRRKTGVFLSVLGFGEGNIKDDKMELLADKGNGNYSYIDTLKEARKVLVEEATSTLMTIAKDVKIQVEFNPAKVGAYRLIGYANRMLKARDFNNDRIDAGEIGAGHTVTALYEIVPPGVAIEGDIDELKYQPPDAEEVQGDGVHAVVESDELFTLKIRYKLPEAAESTKFEIPVIDKGGTLAEASDDFRFASAVAAYGMILRNSEYRGAADYEMVCALAGAAIGPEGTLREAREYLDDFVHYCLTANIELALANARALLKLDLSDVELAMLLGDGGMPHARFNRSLTRALGMEELAEVAGQLQVRLDRGLEILSRVELRPKPTYRSEFIELVRKAAAIGQPRIQPMPVPER
ncbi:MAG: VWA domain-containing protein [Planctomycetes bacterium]|nr:VWA domain-containing protein [Planctomycetota bacterium]